MYKVVIIDDNVHLLRSLSVAVGWGALGCLVAGTATDGAQGLSLIESERPDIIITDIRMPGFDGLEMAERVKGFLPDCRIVVITGYEHFDYARKALQLRADDFLLKPIDIPVFESSLRGVVDLLNIEANRRQVYAARSRQLENRQRTDERQRRRNFLDKLVNAAGGTATVHALSLQPEGFACAGYLVAAVQPLTADGYTNIATAVGSAVRQLSGQAHPMELYDLSLRGNTVLLCFPSAQMGAEQSARLLRLALERLADKGSVGRCVLERYDNAPMTDLRRHCHTCVEELEKLIYFGAQNSALPQKDAPENGWDLREYGSVTAFIDKKVDDLTRCDAPEQTASLIRRLVESLSKEQGKDIYLLQSFMIVFAARFTSQLLGSGLHDKELHLAYITKRVREFTNVAELTEYLCDVYRLCRELRERLHTYPPIIQDFLRYVHEHALKGLSLSEVARELAVTPTYLSSLIKKETGESFTDIVTRERLEVAKKLLTDTRNSIENIGSLIGYRNYISFYKAFKKLVGQTPREYRDHVSRG